MSKSTNSIDGFFNSRRERPAPKVQRAGLDSASQSTAAPKPLSGLRVERRQSAAPGGVSMDEFFHKADTAGATAGSSAFPAPQPLPGEEEGKKRRFRFRKPSKKTVKRIIIALVLLLVIAGGYFVFKVLLAGGQVFKGNVINAIFSQAKELKTDENGRSNILLFGTSEDDPGHPGAELTDSIMVLSINAKKKEAFMVSIPRDINVEYGRACMSGYSGKINVVYQCVKEDEGNNEDAGQTALKEQAAKVTGLNVQYAVHVNYTVLRQAVDAVGGISVQIESDDSRGILDRNFDWKCRYTCYYVKWPNGPVQLDGDHALALARARGDVEPTYGLGRSNFDREQYQQKIILALKDRAVSGGTLANPVAVSGLLDALGANVRTNFDAEEIKTLVKLAQDIKNDQIKRIDLNTEQTRLLDANGQPVAGEFNYIEINKYIKALASGDTSFLEGATVEVLNASGTAGAAQTQADKIETSGITVQSVGNAPTSLNAAPLQLFDVSDGKKPGTLKKLETALGVKAIKQVPAGVTPTSDFVIIVGSNGAS